jgi:hypothetical protein
MAKDFVEVEKIGKENAEAASKSVDMFSNSMQAIMKEFADYRRSPSKRAQRFLNSYAAPSRSIKQ